MIIKNMNMGFLLSTLFFVSLFCFLGVWQWHRYQDKKDLLAAYQTRMNNTAKPLIGLASLQHQSAKNRQFQRVQVQGSYQNQWVFLIQNQLYHQQIGFEVLTPMQMPGEMRWVLIDRGWIPQKNMQDIPIIKPVNGIQRITGYIKELNGYQFILGNTILNKYQSATVIQKIDIDALSQLTQHTFYPFIIRLNAKEPHGFTRDWILVAVAPERHLSYAIQWFAMAMVLFIAYFIFCCRHRHDKK